MALWPILSLAHPSQAPQVRFSAVATHPARLLGGRRRESVCWRQRKAAQLYADAQAPVGKMSRVPTFAPQKTDLGRCKLWSRKIWNDIVVGKENF